MQTWMNAWSGTAVVNNAASTATAATPAAATRASDFPPMESTVKVLPLSAFSIIYAPVSGCTC